MGADILSIGTSGLLAAQRQLQTTSHNVSNVNTEGYTRQRAELEAIIPAYYAGHTGYIGTGVTVQTTVRLSNEFYEEQIRNGNSSYGQYDAFYDLSAQIDNVLANPTTGLTPTLESFYSALQEANDDPSSTPARQVLLTEANVLTDRFQLIDDHFTDLNNEVNNKLVSLASDVTSIASSIASLNIDIVKRIGAGQGSMPNDLIDQREVLIKKLSEKIDINVVYQDDGAANIFIGSGQTLVISGNAAGISTEINKYNSLELDIILTRGNAKEDITQTITGGELQGVLDFREDVLKPSVNSLGRIAIALSEEMNAQNRLGMTIQGSTAPFPLGGDFFTSQSSSPQVLDGQLSSTGIYTVDITNSKLLTTSDYKLDVNTAGEYRLTRLSDNFILNSADLTLNGAQTAAGTQGFDLTENTAAVAGESFLIQPTATAASSIGVQVNNVLDIALASPIIAGEQTDAATGGALNTGTGEISSLVNSNVTNIPLSANGGKITLTYDESLFGGQPNGGGFIVSDLNSSFASANIAFNPATDFLGKTFTFDGVTTPGLPDIGGMSFTLSGIPNDTDTFVIDDNTSPFDDNRNGLLMAQLQTTKTIENGSSDFQGAYGILVAFVGTKTHSAEVDLKAQFTLLEDAKATREGYSGVNLDEEAAFLLKYQQAYQASSKVISSANQMFQDLLNAL
ncbi:MAG: flagellar hook-associated protein FlgK [Proteobacteria bacterium]|nr:flagellar hook-associated protein FlgK [Pseudomonadota bacterium]